MQVFTAGREQQQKRSRLKRNALYALIIFIIGGCFGSIDQLTERLTPKPDYYKLLFTELARQATLATGTPTIVKEDEDTLKLFENEYNRRNAKLGLPEGQVVVSDKGLLQFSYAPGMIEKIGPGLSLIPSSEILRTNTRPMIWEDEEGTRPLVVWTYSERETLLACFVYQMLTADHPLSRYPPRPDLRIIQDIDWKGVVSVQGSVPPVKVFAEHAYLLPLGDMRLENLDPRAREMPKLAVPYLAVPMVASPGYDGTNSPPLPNAVETVELLRSQAARPFTITRRLFRFGVLPLGVLWFGLSCWRLRRLHQDFLGQLANFPSSVAQTRIDFRAFLTLDLERELTAAKVMAQTLEERRLAAERERIEIAEIKDQLRELLSDTRFSRDEARQIERALAAESLVELRELTTTYRQQRERAAELARERQREIEWLEGEFQAIPPLERKQAREAWDLYQKSLSSDDPKEKLHWLKEARKKLPKDLRAS